VYLSDMIGFHLEMGEDQAPDSVATAYMLIHETLLLFSVVRHFWDRGDQASLRNILLIKDGPLTLRGQYSKLVDNIRDLLAFARDRGCPIHVIGQEKTGRFVDHLDEIQRFTEPEENGDLPHNPEQWRLTAGVLPLRSRKPAGVTGSPPPSNLTRRPARTQTPHHRRDNLRQPPTRTRRRFLANATSPMSTAVKPSGRACASTLGVEIETTSDVLAVMSSGPSRYGM